MKLYTVIIKAEVTAESPEEARKTLLRRHPALYAFDCSEVTLSLWQTLDAEDTRPSKEVV